MTTILKLLLAGIVFASGYAWSDTLRFTDPRIEEASGIAVSRYSDAFIWAVNDSGNRPVLFLVDTGSGDTVASIPVSGVTNRDWEDLDSFMLDGVSYLLIADVGDNQRRRAYSQLLVIREPMLPVTAAQLDGLSPESVIRFRYEDGPQDCEAVAVDPATRKILLIGKRTTPPPVYELPLDLTSTATRRILQAKKVGILAGMPTPSPAEILEGPLGPWRYQPTGVAIDSNRTAAAVITYQGVYLYPRVETEDWTSAFAGQPKLLPLPLAQTESITFASGGLLVVAEGRFAALQWLSYVTRRGL